MCTFAYTLIFLSVCAHILLDYFRDHSGENEGFVFFDLHMLAISRRGNGAVSVI